MRILLLNLSAASAGEVGKALSGQGYEIATEAALDVEQIELVGPELLVTEATPSDLSCCGIITQIKSREPTKFIRVLMVVQGGALERARGYIRSELGSLESLYSPPELFFVEDHSAEEAQKVLDILNQLDRERNDQPAVLESKAADLPTPQPKTKPQSKK